MAKAKKIEKFFTRQLNELRDNLEAFCITSGAEKLHNLRLNAKKARAVISMVNNCGHSKKKFSIKQLKELFDHAGKIRTAQLNVGTLHENNISGGNFERDQDLILKRESEELCKRKKTYSKDIKKLQKRISSHSFRLKEAKIIAYYHVGIQ